MTIPFDGYHNAQAYQVEYEVLYKRTMKVRALDIEHAKELAKQRVERSSAVLDRAKLRLVKSDFRAARPLGY
jgi:hypothetical protein